jgi:hypothetical protein
MASIEKQPIHVPIARFKDPDFLLLEWKWYKKGEYCLQVRIIVYSVFIIFQIYGVDVSVKFQTANTCTLKK